MSNYNKKFKRNGFKKRRAIYLLVACQQDVENVARELDIKKRTLQKWINDSEFAEEIEKSMSKIELYDSKTRLRHNSVVVNKIWDEIHKKLGTTKGISDLSVTSLLNMAKSINHEIRLDTPGDATSKSTHTHTHEVMDDLMGRYKEHVSEHDQGSLRLVEMPEKTKKKEVANG